MAVKEFQIDTSLLTRDMDTTEEMYNNLQSTLQQISNAMNELNVMWEGKAKEAFQKAYRDDVEYAENVFKDVKRISDYGKTCRKNYDVCEGKVRSLVEALRG